MKIAVDASTLHSGYTGVGRYLYNVLKHIIKSDKGIKFTLFCSNDIDLDLDHRDVNKIVLRTKRGNLYWQNFKLDKALKRNNFDLFWSPNYYSPVFLKGPSVLSMHDVSWRALPDNYPLLNRTVRDLLSRLSLKKASAVFTISEFSATEIRRYYSVDPSLIKVIHLAVDDSFKRSGNKKIIEFRDKYGLTDGPVIGYLGSIFKRRNIDKLISSYSILKKTYPELKLMLIGEIHDPEVDSLLRRNPSIILKKRLPENEVNDFYSSLDLFVYISEYEGFGLPPLEALKCGTIPLLLNKTSLKEIFTEIALFINDAEPLELSARIDEYFRNSKKIQKEIFTLFRKKEGYFKWERVAEEYIDVFNSLIHSEPEGKEK